jgi:alcohol dehydrogenase class IV
MEDYEMAKIGYYAWIQRSVMEVGPNCRTAAPLRMSSMGSVRPALFTDSGVLQAGVADLVKEVFETQGGPKIVGVYTNISPEYTGAEANECARWLRENAIDGIIAVGGGSVLDCMKTVKVMLGLKTTDVWELMPDMAAAFTEPEAKHLGIPHLGFPTTAGTGAEISPFSVVTNEKANIKGMLAHPYMGADYAFLDPYLTINLPPRMTALSGFDALSHAIEGLTALGTNDMLVAFAAKAIKIIRQNLPTVVADGNNIDARTRMLVASHMGIVAICLCGLTVPVHNVSHALGAALHIPHGEAISVTMPNLMENFPNHYLQAAPALSEAFELDPRMKADEIVASSVQIVRELQKKCGIKNKFSSVIDKNTIEKLCVDVKSDPAGAMYEIPQDVVRRCIASSFNVLEGK